VTISPRARLGQQQPNDVRRDAIFFRHVVIDRCQSAVEPASSASCTSASRARVLLSKLRAGPRTIDGFLKFGLFLARENFEQAEAHELLARQLAELGEN